MRVKRLNPSGMLVPDSPETKRQVENQENLDQGVGSGEDVSLREGVCGYKYTHIDSGGPFEETQCGKIFTLADGLPFDDEECNYKYCPYCGKKIIRSGAAS